MNIFPRSTAKALGAQADTAIQSKPDEEKSSKPAAEEPEWLKQKKLAMGQGFDIRKMSKQEIQQKFDKHAPHWDVFVQEGKYKVLEWIKKESTFCKGKQDSFRVLDLACAIGLVSKTMQEAGIKGHYTGVDISQKMLDVAKDTAKFDRLICHDLDKPLDAIKGEKFDIVVCTGATELLDADAMMKWVAPLLKEISQVWLTFQHNDGKESPTAHQGMKTYKHEEVHDMLNKYGVDLFRMENLTDAYYIPVPGKKEMQPVPYLLAIGELQNEFDYF